MSRTFVPDFRDLDPDMDLKEVLAEIRQEYVISWGDYDKAGDMEDHAYYAGLIDAYNRVVTLLTVPDPEKKEK